MDFHTVIKLNTFPLDKINNPKTKKSSSNGESKIKQHTKTQSWPMAHKGLGSGQNQVSREEKIAGL